MLYLNKDHLDAIGTNWHALIGVIQDAILNIHQGEYSQPVKPYLRYKNSKNRIIAMPAYIGGNTSMAGIKWIASFPDNFLKNLPRAHSVTILNEEDTGKPLCTVNTTAISAIRTAAVSGVIIDAFKKARQIPELFNVSIIGFGPIGRIHLQMVESLMEGRMGRICLYDLKGIERDSIDSAFGDKIQICNSWQECYTDADIFITCTVSDNPYVDLPPKKGSLHLNVSLRDYTVSMRKYMDVIIVDDWVEVCRQNTDIENMHKLAGLQLEDTISMIDLICNCKINLNNCREVVMFNPMGMAVFDIAIGGYYYKEAVQKAIGMLMPD
ncbi:MAG: 2,3-diaminopropionate biosynthesis protein SbnB [Chitinophagaceae bacterium]